MGIRYYAYAFDSNMTELALADPRSFLADDPLADAWGLEPGFSVGTTNFEQAVPETDMLYLDKAWRHMQSITAPTPPHAVARAAHRMFEGDVTFTDMGWIPWVRALSPAEVELIARDLERITEAEVSSHTQGSAYNGRDIAEEVNYALEYLKRAQVFATNLASSGRGMAYMIG